MLKIFKFMKKSVFALLFVAILLIIQATCDLSLPTYTSNIVNIGIMKGGLESTVPKVIRKTEFDKLTQFMDKAEKDTILSHYTLLAKENFTEKKWSNYLNEYPLLASEPLYVWDQKEEDSITQALYTPTTLVYLLESDSDMAKQIQNQILANIPSQLKQASTDIFTILSMLPAENRDSLTSTLRSKLSDMPEILLTQTAAAFVKAEYTEIGVDLNQIQINYLMLVGAKMLGLALLSMLASITVVFFGARIAARMGRELRSNVFKRVLSFSHKEMDQFSTASLITRSTNDIQQVQLMTVMMIRIVFYAPILALGGIIKVIHTNSSMTWILGVAVGTIFLLIGSLYIVAMPKFKKMQILVDRTNLVMREILTGLPVIRAFSTVAHEEKRFDKANVDLTKNTLFVNRVMVLMMPALMLIMNFVSILIIWVGAKGIDNSTMQVGDMMAFIQYTMQIIMAFLFLTLLSIMLPRAVVAANRIDEVLSTKASIKDPESVEETDASKKGIIEFCNVNFRYPNAEEDVLSDISFVAKPGETTAIIGSTGSGKSTLINLIPRFYDVTGGKILISGTDITKIKQHKLREKLGFIPQKGILFTGTVESNIKFADPSLEDRLMKQAARIAQAEEFIESKPEGYQTSISQGGTNVSGGQKQRLSIARAIAKNPDIYIFDDSFSALDYKTDSALRKSIKEELTGSTVIIVAQRVSTIMHAEQILVLDEGRIVGKGTHKELLKNCAVYQQIAESQLSKEELDYE